MSIVQKWLWISRSGVLNTAQNTDFLIFVKIPGTSWSRILPARTTNICQHSLNKPNLRSEAFALFFCWDLKRRLFSDPSVPVLAWYRDSAANDAFTCTMNSSWKTSLCLLIHVCGDYCFLWNAAYVPTQLARRVRGRSTEEKPFLGLFSFLFVSQKCESAKVHPELF